MRMISQKAECLQNYDLTILEFLSDAEGRRQHMLHNQTTFNQPFIFPLKSYYIFFVPAGADPAQNLTGFKGVCKKF